MRKPHLTTCAGKRRTRSGPRIDNGNPRHRRRRGSLIELSRARPRRVLIVGGEATGKTTLARELASSLKYPEYELDEIAWQSTRGPDVSLRGVFEPDFQDREPLVQRPLQDRLSRIRAIAAQPSWIAEGVFLVWTDLLFQQADAIVWLDQVGIVPIVGRILARHARSAYREIGLRDGREKFTRIRDYARVHPTGDIGISASVISLRAGVPRLGRHYAGSHETRGRGGCETPPGKAGSRSHSTLTSTIALTMNTYSHVIPELQREAADKMEAVLGA